MWPQSGGEFKVTKEKIHLGLRRGEPWLQRYGHVDRLVVLASVLVPSHGRFWPRGPEGRGGGMAHPRLGAPRWSYGRLPVVAPMDPAQSSGLPVELHVELPVEAWGWRRASVSQLEL